MLEYDIIDTTLREGEQTPGVLFSLTEKQNILDGLVQVGVTEVELGISSRFHPCTGDLIAYGRRAHPGLRLSLWSRCRTEDIDWAAGRRPDFLSLSIPVSDLHLEKRLQKSREWARRTMCEAIAYARRQGLAVAIGFEDATRAEPRFLAAMAKAAEERGVVRIRLADTVGIGSPRLITGLVDSLKGETGCPLAIHTHNDFGMATANGIAALEAGARAVDTVILGLGERTGCARLEEVAAYLCLVQGMKNIKTEHLKPLACYVAGITGRTVEGNRPVVGEDIFTCETGLHLQGLQNDPKTYEPFAPEKVAGRRKLLIGPKSGRRAILAHLGRNEGQAGKLSDQSVRLVRETALNLKRPLSETELRQLVAVSEARNQKPEAGL